VRDTSRQLFNQLTFKVFQSWNFWM